MGRVSFWIQLKIWSMFITCSGMCAILITSSLVNGLPPQQDWLPLLALISGCAGGVALSLWWWRDVKRNARVRITEHELVLVDRKGKEILLEWSQIAAIKPPKLSFSQSVGEHYVVHCTDRRTFNLRDVWPTPVMEDTLHDLAPAHVNLKLAFSERLPDAE